MSSSLSSVGVGVGGGGGGGGVTRGEKVAKLQYETSSIRNICILAHVDHGKTTLSDCLVSSNGIISERLAGTIRFLDSREDEQERGITMQSSAISLIFKHERLNREYLINLIDSPGHVDFSSDVSTAVRLCDGALVVVDVIEGVAIQTHAVLRQAWEERLQPCLVLNKVDKLITELHLEPVEAFEHLQRIIENVNAIVQSFFSASVMEEAFRKQQQKQQEQEEREQSSETMNQDGNGVSESDSQKDDSNWAQLEFDDSEEAALSFSPEKGNVVFASAVDSWAFRVIDFAPAVAEMIELPKKKVLKSLWGNYFYNPKTKTIISPKQVQASVTTGQASRSKPPMFATFILSSIWAMYDATVLDSKPKKLAKMISKLGIQEKVKSRDVSKGGKIALRAVMHAWLPVTKAILSMVVRHVPDPAVAQKRRAEILWPQELMKRSPPEMEESLLKIRASIDKCDPNGPLVAFVTKIFAIERKMLSPETLKHLKKLQDAKKLQTQQASDGAGQDQIEQQQQQQQQQVQEQEQEEFFFAFARIFSGTLKPGVPVHVLGPKYIPGVPDRERHQSVAQNGVIPMLIMNTELAAMDSIPAGNVLAIAGLEDFVLKTATIAQTSECCSLSKMPTQSAPILRVSLEPSNPLQWPQLANGLRLLNRADPMVEVRVQPNGEHIVGAIGELHLERCIKDLQERFAKIQLKVSQPIAIFRETVVIHINEEAVVQKPSPKQVFAPISILEEEEKFEKAVKLNQELQANANVENGDTETNNNMEKPKLQKLIPLSKKVFPGGRVVASTAGNYVSIILRVIPLPEPITRVLEELRPSIQRLVDASEDIVPDLEDGETGEASAIEMLQRRSSSHRTSRVVASLDSINLEVTDDNDSKRNSQKNGLEENEQDELNHLREEVYKKMNEAFESAGADWGPVLFKNLMNIGPRGNGPNCLFNLATKNPFLRANRWAASILKKQLSDDGQETEEADLPGSDFLWEEIISGIFAGFQLASAAGPLCEEPLWGVAILIEDVQVKDDQSGAMAAARSKSHNTIAGQVMSAVKETIRRGFDVHRLHHEHNVQTGCQVRLVEGVLKCMLQCHVESHQGDQLGKMYSVLSKRRAKVESEDIWEGTSIFTIEALIPVVESFKLGDDLRIQTSGAASTPQMIFSHWQVIPENPYFRATTEDELEEFGENGYEESYMANNQARKYIDQVRKRKGLQTNEKVVIAAEKQRTLARKK